MLVALATLAFLTTFWMLGLIALRMADESGGRMLAALRGHSPLAYSVRFAPVTGRISARSRQARSLRVHPRWRAAA